MRARERPWSPPASIGLNVFVTITGRLPLLAIHFPIDCSLRPPPYASAVSNVRIPSDQATSINSNACSSLSPWPKNCGAEPTPPKFPQPRTSRSIARFSLRHAVRGARAVPTAAAARRARTRPSVFRLWPNGPSQLRAGSRLTVEVRGARRPDPTTLVLPRRRTVSFGWPLRLPRDHLDRIARFRNGIRVGTFLPLLAWDDRRGWLTDPPARILAESAATPVADFDIRVAAPSGFRVVATGVQYGRNRFRATAVRDFALAIGHFRVQSA